MTEAASASSIVLAGEHFVVADKPAGVLSVPSRMGDRDPRPCLGRELERRVGARLWPVHRLDEEVSGIILFARTATAHVEANRWFEQHLVRKTYEALTGIPAGWDGRAGVAHEWHSRLLRGKKRAYESPHGKPSLTRAVLDGERELAGQRALAWTLQPVTGRAHQLRYELARHAAPILGDVLYGASSPLSGGAVALRCVRLEVDAAVQPERFGLPATMEVMPLAAWLAERQAR